eukprot:CAMPEP_0197349606 /NCGR_PEP_ID=MMETSP0893-20130614/10569_1 /TAXON_ID=44058 ORGANISM="Aureoumbra lagunensis, Strain CCMP1510" /NCGR_SAMPLE_ID=MMETSP0893 /ASSEMBLY_ACC=CAM_ASM_000539 /LENGTH=36 /DNA_ID= /DNA_START= /DNA_END= /DNA_ORIENTATION=
MVHLLLLKVQVDVDSAEDEEEDVALDEAVPLKPRLK